MIIEKEEITITRSGDFKEQSFGIREEDKALVFETLRDLYSDAPLAILREYAANAYDSHVEAGKADVPIEITMPNRFNPVLEVKDRGLGLSEEDVFGVFCFYGASGDKRNRSDTIGGFGIGGKCAFSYGDAFSVESIYNGVKSFYTAYIDETRIGKMALLTQEATDEENGVTVKIPVKPEDIPLFKRAAETIFEFWSTRPIIHGLELNMPERRYLISGDGWGIFSFDSYRSIAVINNIPYKITLDFLDYNSEFRIFQKFGMVFEFSYSDVEVNKSRENIKLTKKSRDYILETFRKIKENISKEIIEKINDASNLIEATKIYNNFFETDLNARAMSVLIGTPKWNGKKVSSHISFEDEIYNHSSRLYAISRNIDSDGNTKISKSYRRLRSFTPNDNTVLIFTRENVKDVYLRDVVNKYPAHKIFVLHYGDTKDKEHYKELLSWYNPLILEDFDRIVVRNPRRARGARLSVTKYDYRVFESGNWNPETEVDFEEDIKFIRVDLERNKASGEDHLKAIIVSEYIAFNELEDVIIGINKSVSYKFKKVKTVSLDEYISEINKDINHKKNYYAFICANHGHRANLKQDARGRFIVNEYDGYKTKSLYVLSKKIRAIRNCKVITGNLNKYIREILGSDKNLVESKAERINMVAKDLQKWSEKHPILLYYRQWYSKDETINYYVDLLEKTLDKQA